MSLGVISPIRNKGLYSDWLSAAPLATSMLTIDTSGNVGSQAIPVAAWGSITGTLSSQTDLQNALNAKLSLSGGTMTGAITGTSNIVEFASSTSSQTVRLYNTFTDTSNYIRQSLSFTTYSSTVHARIAAEGAGTGAVNVPFVITPRGTGAFIVGPMPDGTATGGNARGANAIDLRIAARASASDVASGSQSFLGPNGTSATGTGSVAFGGNATGTNTFCLGPLNNSASGGVCLGVGTEGANSASGVGSIVLSGRYNGSQGNYAMVGGQSCNAAAVASLAFGESCNTISGEPFSFGWGTFAIARLENEYAQASGRFAAQGDCQFIRHILRATSATNTAVELLFGLSRNKRFTIPAGYIFHGTVTIIGIKSDGSVVASYMRQVAIVRVSNSTSMSGTVNTIGTDQPSGTSITIDADDTNEALRIQCTGITSETWRWQAVVQGGMMAYGT
jgi:hypothetical protein